MYLLIKILEIMGTVSFALSGAMMALQKKMDLLGTCVLGITTAIGGGVLRDIILGITPPTSFVNPTNLIIAAVVSLTVFVPILRRALQYSKMLHELIFSITDAVGLGVFTAVGVQVAIQAGFGDNWFLVAFVATITGVGGGVIRDIICQELPQIFVGQIYACASLAGAIVCMATWSVLGSAWSMVISAALVVIIRLLSIRMKWSLPKA